MYGICLPRNLIHSKIYNPTKYREVPLQYFTAHYACRNADLNLKLVGGTTDGFIFQIITSLIESWGVRLTCFDCNIVPIVVLVLESKRLCQRVCEQAKLKSKNCKLTYLSIMSICSEYLCCCHLILGQSASFIGANHTSTAKRLHNRKLLYDSISSSHSHYTQG